MSRTLFWYILKDLLKIFMMASGALAGIMSFGGLLRPLTQQGLDASQVSKMLTYFTFPMMAYSLPVAALFSATVVYGRLSADNELTACRAGGISHLGIAMPAFVLGLVVALISLLMLCFLVPVYTLKVEKVIYSNLAKLIANRIDRTHEIQFGAATIFAQKAFLPPPEQNSGRQRVVLDRVSIVSYQKPEKVEKKPDARSRPAGAPGTDAKVDRKSDPNSKIPREFLLASSATIYISEREDDQVDLLVGLEGGTRFPREFKSGQFMGVSTTQFGPLEIPSPIKEDTKFMNIWRLKELYHRPDRSRRIIGQITGYVRHDQTTQYLHEVKAALESFSRTYKFVSPDGTTRIQLTRKDASAPVVEEAGGEELVVGAATPGAVEFIREGLAPTVQWAQQLRLRVHPDAIKGTMSVTVELIGRSPGGAGRPVSGTYSDVIDVHMPTDVQAMGSRGVRYYLTPEKRKENPGQWNLLKHEHTVLFNAILAEAHGRASFAVSCFILVLVGCALGMMFRSGNFLTAFAVSFIPALVCITLIVAGQQTCHAVPWKPDQRNPLNMGLMLIWGGNAINALIATSLLWRLQRQ